jgi:hypothetical protein
MAAKRSRRRLSARALVASAIACLFFLHGFVLAASPTLTTYFEVRNVGDSNYVGSASIFANRVSLVGGAVVQNGYADMARNGVGSIFAGNPRVFQAGVKFKF